MPSINILWEGPFSAQTAEQLTGDTDCGVYAAYGRTPVYGPGTVLLYIGQANAQTFGARIQQHEWRYGGSWNGGAPIQFYVGRLCGYRQPDDDTWGELIDVAERLLIHTHAPSWNSHRINLDLPEKYTDTHVFNWGYYRDLLPEVSGARWYVDPNGLDNIWRVAG